MSRTDDRAAIEDIADQVREEAARTGRKVREILTAMRDEGYIQCSDNALEQCGRMAEAPAHGQSEDGK